MGSLDKGKQELSYDLEKNHVWFIEDGSSSAVFAWAFLCLPWNLICHVDSTEGLYIKHLVWSQGSVGIWFSHMKNDQNGSKNFKPCQCYTNPEDYTVCPITVIFECLCCSPDILQYPDLLIFLVVNKTTDSGTYWSNF